MTSTKSIPDILEDGFRKVYFDEFGRYEDEFGQIYACMPACTGPLPP